jgi:hypothetical protein
MFLMLKIILGLIYFLEILLMQLKTEFPKKNFLFFGECIVC